MPTYAANIVPNLSTSTRAGRSPKSHSRMPSLCQRCAAFPDGVTRPPAAAGGLVTPSGKAAHRWHKDGIREWDFGDLPARVEVDRFGTIFAAYVGIVDQKTSAALRLFDTPAAAVEATRGGVRRLFLFEAGDELNRRTRGLPAVERMCVQFATLGQPAAFRQGLLELIADRALFADDPAPTTERAYRASVREATSRLDGAVREVCQLGGAVMEAFQAVQLRLLGKAPAAWAEAVADIRDQLARLLPPAFLISTPFKWLQQYPRYLTAIDLRL